MTVITGDLIVCDVVFVHEAEIIVFIDPFSDVMTGITFVLRDDVIRAGRNIRMAGHAFKSPAQMACMVKVGVVVMHLFWRAVAGRATRYGVVAGYIPEVAGKACGCRHNYMPYLLLGNIRMALATRRVRYRLMFCHTDHKH